jgi:hypothetical protein
MSVANDALLSALGAEGLPVIDNLSAANTTQATATRCTAQVSRFTKVAATGTAVLPSLLSYEAQFLVFVINDDPTNALLLWPFGTETKNGANSAFSVPVGQSAICIAVRAAQVGKGGGFAPGSIVNDWRIAAVP